MCSSSTRAQEGLIVSRLLRNIISISQAKLEWLNTKWGQALPGEKLESRVARYRAERRAGEV